MNFLNSNLVLKWEVRSFAPSVPLSRPTLMDGKLDNMKHSQVFSSQEKEITFTTGWLIDRRHVPCLSCHTAMKITSPVVQLSLGMTNSRKEKQIRWPKDTLPQDDNTRIIYGLFWHFYSGHLSCSRCPAGWPEPLNRHHSILSPGSGLPDGMAKKKLTMPSKMGNGQ